MVLEDFREPLIRTCVAKGCETGSYSNKHKHNHTYTNIIFTDKAHLCSNGLRSASTPDSTSA
jgi:hypothetical protein